MGSLICDLWFSLGGLHSRVTLGRSLLSDKVEAKLPEGVFSRPSGHGVTRRGFVPMGLGLFPVRWNIAHWNGLFPGHSSPPSGLGR